VNWVRCVAMDLRPSRAKSMVLADALMGRTLRSRPPLVSLVV